MLKVKELFWTPLRVFWTYNMDKEIFLKVNIVTIFPEFFRDPLNTSIPSRAMEQGLVEYQLVDLRSGKIPMFDTDQSGNLTNPMQKLPNPMALAYQQMEDDIMLLNTMLGEAVLQEAQTINQISKNIYSNAWQKEKNLGIPPISLPEPALLLQLLGNVISKYPKNEKAKTRKITKKLIFSQGLVEISFKTSGLILGIK